MKTDISLKEIAQLAQVSTATVSRVINHNGRFSKETEQRVLKIIDEYNYSPNQLARGLRMSRSQIVGIVVPDITNEYFAKLIQTIQNRLFYWDYPVAIYNTNESKAVEEKCLRYLRSQNVSGVIYINGNAELEGDLLQEVPTIYVDRQPPETLRNATKYVSSDNEAGGYLATREMLDAGCRHIAVMTERFGTFVMTERYKGYVRALAESGMKPEEALVFIPDAITYDAAYKIVKKEIESGTSFDGIFCQTDWLASGAIDAILSCQKRVPEDVKVVGFDNISIASLSHLPFTTVEQKFEHIGNFAADTMIDMINELDRKNEVKVFPVDIIRRQTT